MNSPPAGDVSRTPASALREACRYWEMRRLPFNLALAAVFAAWLLCGPPLGPVTAPDLLALLALALAANALHCTAYPIDLALRHRPAGWHRYGRAVLWSLGTMLALALESYWIADEIIPRLG